jgi:hypothetical protein
MAVDAAGTAASASLYERTRNHTAAAKATPRRTKKSERKENFLS